MHPIFGKALGTIGLVLLTAGCGQKQRPGGDVPPMTGDVSMVIQNHHWNDVILYVIHDGVSERVGTVTAATTKSFILPMRRFGSAGAFRLGVTQIGGQERHLTETLVIRQGDHITYTLESDLDRSSVMIQ